MVWAMLLEVVVLQKEAVSTQNCAVRRLQLLHQNSACRSDSVCMGRYRDLLKVDFHHTAAKPSAASSDQFSVLELLQEICGSPCSEGCQVIWNPLWGSSSRQAK